MKDSSNNHDLFSASLEAIETGKRVEKYERFKSDFQREYIATLENAQEWIKAELPIVTEYVDAAAIKEELKQPKTSGRRKHLLSALLFEKNLRSAVEKNNAATASIMAMHMFNRMWLAKIELQGGLPTATRSSEPVQDASDSAIQTYNDTREKILTTLIEKGEQLKKDSQIQSGIKPRGTPNPAVDSNVKNIANNSDSAIKENNSFDSMAEKPKHIRGFTKTKVKTKKSKKKSNSVLAKVKTKIPLKRKSKRSTNQKHIEKPTAPSVDDSLLEDPNRSAIIVNPGFSESIDDSLIRARTESARDPNESGVTVHKVLKKREHEKQDPGSNTIIMKLSSSNSKRPAGKLSIPEQCQDAINMLTQQFPGYDMVAIRNMAAEKVGVSPQYIENLNILPDKSI